MRMNLSMFYRAGWLVLSGIALACGPVTPAWARSPDSQASQAVVIDSQTGESGGPSAVVYQTKPHPHANGTPARPAVPAIPATPARPAQATQPAGTQSGDPGLTPVIVVQPGLNR